MPKPNQTKQKTLVEDFVDLLKSINPNYASAAASLVNRPRFSRIYRELSRLDEDRESSYMRRR